MTVKKTATGTGTTETATGTGTGIGGRVESVRVAVVRTDAFTRVKSGRSGIDKRPVAGPVGLGVHGVAGDTICDVRNHGGPDQAVYAYAVDDLAFWVGELGRPVATVGENLLLSGIDCSGAVIGERWRIGGAELVVRGPRIPCAVFAGFLDVPDMIKRFIAARRPGCYLAVAQEGDVEEGDAVAVTERPAHGVTVIDLMAAMTGDRSVLPRLHTARESLGATGRAWLDRVDPSA